MIFIPVKVPAMTYFVAKEKRLNCPDFIVADIDLEEAIYYGHIIYIPSSQSHTRYLRYVKKWPAHRDTWCLTIPAHAWMYYRDVGHIDYRDLKCSFLAREYSTDAVVMRGLRL